MTATVGAVTTTEGGERELVDVERESTCAKEDHSGGNDPPIDDATDAVACGPTLPGPPEG